VITVWNGVTGGINGNVGSSYADYSPTLLGVTAQNTGGGLTIYNNKLPGAALDCNYCTGVQAMKDFIASGSQGWSRNEPRFLFIQAQPWQDVRASSFLEVAQSLSSDYVVVRPDILFQLVREAKGLVVNPGGSASETPAGYTRCAAEGGSASFSQPMDVAYGANGSFNFKSGVTGSITFNNATFRDPISGVAKAGYSRTPGGPAGYTWCANENSSYTFNQPVDVAYGANGAFSYRTAVTGAISFDNSSFVDRSPGVAKAGYYRIPAAPAGYTFCANQNASYTFNQTV